MTLRTALAALLCCAGSLGAQDAEASRAYELLLPVLEDPGSRADGAGGAAASPPGVGGVLLLEDEEAVTQPLLRALLERALGERAPRGLHVLLHERGGPAVIEATGDAGQLAALEAALPEVQRQLDAMLLSFELRVLEHVGDAPPREAARLPLRVIEGQQASAALYRADDWLSFGIDHTGAFPRVRAEPRTYNSGVFLEVDARRTTGDRVLTLVRARRVSREPSEALAWEGLGALELPRGEDHDVWTALYLRPGAPARVATLPWGDRQLSLELRLAAPTAAPALPVRCCTSPWWDPEASLHWSDELSAGERPRRPGSSSFAFEDEDERPALFPIDLCDPAWTPVRGWVVPADPAQARAVEALLGAWEDSHGMRTVELAWGRPAEASGSEPPLRESARVSVVCVSGVWTRVTVGRERSRVQGVWSSIAGPEGEPPRRADAPLYGRAFAGWEALIRPARAGCLDLAWSLRGPAEREALALEAGRVTLDRAWSWQGEATLDLAGAGWTLVAEAPGPDGEPRALYARAQNP